MLEDERQMGGFEKMKANNVSNPTFSSILLDEIYRSMVEDDMSAKLDKQKEGDAMTLRKACLVEKWMEGKVRDKVTSLEKRKPQQFIADPDLDSLLFTSSSSCSDNSSGGLFSDNDSKALPLSCDLGKHLNPIRTLRSKELSKVTPRPLSTQKPSIPADTVGKSKPRASMMYDNLKKMKHPVSPGAKLTSFINSLYQATKQAAKSRVRDDSVCIGNGTSSKVQEVKRNVSFLPRCGILKERKNLCPREDAVKPGQDSGRRRGSNSARFGEVIVTGRKSSKLGTSHGRDGGNCLKNTKCGDVSGATAEEDDDSDALSCASSDLFELRHITYARCR